MISQTTLLPPIAAFEECALDDANKLLVQWGHRMGPINRGEDDHYGPTGQYVLLAHGSPIAVATHSTLIRSYAGGGLDFITRANGIELSRLCAARPGICRVMLRLWREFVFPLLDRRYAISYQDADLHNGNTYRFDGWRRSADPIERARRTIVRCFMGHGSTSARKHRTGFRAASHPGRKGGGFGDWRGYPDAIDCFTDRLQGVVIECVNAFALIERHDALDALFYMDPPYPLDVRPSMRAEGDMGSRAYKYELTDDEHRQLAGVLHRLTAAVIVSGYACHLYDEELYAGWERHEHKARADGGVDRTEVIWIKPAGVQLSVPSTLMQGGLFSQ